MGYSGSPSKSVPDTWSSKFDPDGWNSPTRLKNREMVSHFLRTRQRLSKPATNPQPASLSPKSCIFGKPSFTYKFEYLSTPDHEPTSDPPSKTETTPPTLESITARIHEQSDKLKALLTSTTNLDVKIPNQLTHVFVIAECCYVKKKYIQLNLAGTFSTVEAANERAMKRFREHMSFKEDEDLTPYARGSSHRCIALDGVNGKGEGLEIQVKREAIGN